jgi:hypothetical protein
MGRQGLYETSRIQPRRSEGPFAGHEWDVTIIGANEAGDNIKEVNGSRYILSANGRLYSFKALEASAPMWEGVKVYDNHLTDAEFDERQGMRSVAKEWVGTLVEPYWDGREYRLKATLKVVDESLAAKLKAASDQDVLESIGLSIDTLPESREAEVDGANMPIIEGFQKIYSVDLVAEPAAGGAFNRLIASQTFTRGGYTMEKELRRYVEQLVDGKLKLQEADLDAIATEITGVMEEAIKEMEADKAAQGQPANVEEIADAVADVMIQALEQAIEEIKAEGGVPEKEKAPKEEPGMESRRLARRYSRPAPARPAARPQENAAMRRVAALESKIMLRDKLDHARLSPSHRKIVETAFSGKNPTEREVVAMVRSVKEAQARTDSTGRVRGAGVTRPQVRMGMAPRDIAEIEFMRLVAGNTEFNRLQESRNEDVMNRLPESYKTWQRTGRPYYGTRRISEWAYNLLGGDPMADQRAYEAVTTSSMSSIVKNTVNILLAANYAKKHLWWEPIVRTEEVDTIDQATLVRVYGINTLSVVDEGQAYSELAWTDEEETASFVKKGGYVGVTLETLLADKLNVIRTLPERLATSWYNTLSNLVSGVFTCNTATGPVLADTGALFNATAIGSAGGHVNLLTAAASYTALDAAWTAMMKQTDQALGAGQRLLIEPKYALCPVDLKSALTVIRNTEKITNSGNNDVNPYYQRFEVVPVPGFTDTNDWALVADPQEFPAIWLIFLRGKKVPELFESKSETDGAMFTNDTMRFKVRMLTWRYSSTYDCAPVSDFRPLHKSNV